MKKLIQQLFIYTFLITSISINVFGHESSLGYNHEIYHNEEYHFDKDDYLVKLKQSFILMFDSIGVRKTEFENFYEYIKINNKAFFYDLERITSIVKSDSIYILTDELFIENKDNFIRSYKNYTSGIAPSDNYLNFNDGDEVLLKKDNSNSIFPSPLLPLVPNGPCENTGFQNGTTSGWTGSYGTSTYSINTTDKKCSSVFDTYNAANDECCPLFGSCSPWTPADGYVQVNQNNFNQNAGFNSAANNTAANAGTPGVHTVMTGGFDPIIPGNALSVVPPNGNNSIRLGYAKSGYNAQALRQTFMVSNANKNFIYHFAAILNDPQTGHTDLELPFLKIRMYDENDNLIDCATLDVSTSNAASNAGFIQVTGTDNKPIFWKDWTSITIPLNNYMGQNVTIEFITSNCSQSGHYGYAYISANCNPQEIVASSPTICGGQTITLTAPPGLDTYTWTGPGIISGQGTGVLTVNQPGNYSVTMTTETTPPFTPCSFTIDTIIPGNPDFPTAQFTPNPANICAGSPITFNNTSFVSGASVIDSVQWDFNSDGIIDDRTTSPSHTYPSIGNYTVTLTVFSGGCEDQTTQNVTVTAGTTASFTATTVCRGDATSFTNNSSGGANMWSWDFNGDGVEDSSTENPSFTFPTSGTHPVTLTVTNNGSCAHDTTINVTVDQGSTANFTATTVCIGLTTDFTDISSAGVDSWNWDFNNDGVIDNTNQNPSYTFPNAGTFSVNLEVATGGTCAHDTTIDVTVNALPTANFSANAACEGSITSFNDNSIAASGVQFWDWDFNNDGITDASTQNPTYNFPSAGTYPVNLSITDNNGCVNDTTINIITDPLPTANFIFTNVCFGTSNSFTDSSLPNGATITSWKWDFDNNGTIDNTNQNTTHGYSNAGSYNVKLIVETQSGCKDSIIQTVYVNPLPVANFTATDVCYSATTSFNDISTISSGTINGWSWDFNDGVGTSIAQNPTYTYPNAGLYNVSLTVASDSQCTHTISKQVEVFNNPTAAFTTTDVCFGTMANFNSSTSNGNGETIDQWSWDFNYDGVTHTSDNATQNPSYNYTVAGTYDVQLIVTTSNGCSDTIIESITIFPKPLADFTFNDECFGTAIDFTDNSTISTGSITDWNWDFDNGNNSTTQNPSELYANDGDYNVTLIITSDNNCKDTISETINVWPLPIVDFSTSNVCLNNPTTFTNLSTVSIGNNIGWSWDFDDGSGSAIQSPSHTYASEGVYQVQLTVTTDKNCVDSNTKSITVYPLPVINFSADTTEGCTPVIVNFSDNSSIVSGSIDSWFWNFGNAGTSNIENPTNVIFTNPSHTSVATFGVSLTVKSNHGCVSKDSIVNMITSYPKPLARFTYNPTDADIYDTEIIFTDNSIVPSQWLWEFGDGNTSLNQHPIHEYPDTGLYNVTLYIENIYGCKDTAQSPLKIHPTFAIWIPNAFTPDGDNINDYFTIKGYGIEQLETLIFDRWGELVFEDYGIEPKWDGMYKGNLVKSDVYVYKVKARDIFGEWHDFIGKVTLLK